MVNLIHLANSIIAQTSMVVNAMSDVTSKDPSAQATPSNLLFGLTGEAWDRWLIGAVYLAAIAAAAVGITTAGSIISHKREAERAQIELETYKTEVAGKVADATKQGIEAGTTAINAVATAAEANRVTAELRVELEREKVERLRLQEKVQWRTITDEQITKLRDELATASGVVIFIYNSGDNESFSFSYQIAKSFDLHNWNVDSIERNMDGELFVGVSIPDSDAPALSIVRQAFIQAKIPFSTQSPQNADQAIASRSYSKQSVNIFVGSKPLSIKMPSP